MDSDCGTVDRVVVLMPVDPGLNQATVNFLLNIYLLLPFKVFFFGVEYLKKNYAFVIP